MAIKESSSRRTPPPVFPAISKKPAKIIASTPSGMFGAGASASRDLRLCQIR